MSNVSAIAVRQKAPSVLCGRPISVHGVPYVTMILQLALPIAAVAAMATM